MACYLTIHITIFLILSSISAGLSIIAGANIVTGLLTKDAVSVLTAFAFVVTVSVLFVIDTAVVTGMFKPWVLKICFSVMLLYPNHSHFLVVLLGLPFKSGGCQLVVSKIKITLHFCDNTCLFRRGVPSIWRHILRSILFFLIHRAIPLFHFERQCFSIAIFAGCLSNIRILILILILILLLLYLFRFITIITVHIKIKWLASRISRD